MAYASYLAKKKEFDKKYNKKQPSTNTQPQPSGGPVSGENSINRTSGKRMKCYICGSPDHLIPQRPKRHTADSAENEILFTQGNLKSEQDHHFIVDAGATSSIASEHWLHGHNAWLESIGKKPGSLDEEARTQFKFGNGSTKMSKGVAHAQVCLGGKWLKPQCHIFDCKCPQLLSRQGLANLKATINLENSEIYFGAINQTIRLQQSADGHFLVNFRDVHTFAGIENENEHTPTNSTVVEGLFAFLGEEKAVPFMGGQSQAEPLYGALAEKPADPSAAPLVGGPSPPA